MHIRPIKTQKINHNLSVVRTLISNFYIYSNGEESICFDTGYMPPIINKAFRKLGISKENISTVFLTHSDFDHVGGIKLFKKADIYLSGDEEEMITFKKPRVLFIFNKRIRKPYQLLNDGDVIYVGNIQVKAIKTPGHTIGSMSYLVDETYLFTGDTLTVKDNQIKPFFFMQNMNNVKDKKSVEQIKEIKGLKMICTGHSGYLEL